MNKNAMNGLLKQAQKMQKEMDRVQAELAEIQVEGTAGGSMVKAIVSGQQQLVEIKIDPEVVDPDDVDMLEDLVLAAVNQALENVKSVSEQKMAGVTGGMKLPGF